MTAEDSAVRDLHVGEHDMLSVFKPDTLLGALVYLVVFILLAMVFSRVLRATVHAAMTRQGQIDRTTMSFIQQFGSALIWVIMLILYAHLIPTLRSMGTALLAGASVASVVIGLAAQSTLGNLVAGISITIYKPFRLGDTLQVATPTGTEIGIVELISLGYTTLRAPDGRLVVLPNSVAASQVVLNLSSTYAPLMTSILLRVNRDADLEAVRKLAIAVATETVGEKSVRGCFLTKVEASTAELELRFQVPDAGGRESTRATLISRLVQRFAELEPNAVPAQRASFS
jgi:small conductance mechanosensitive channel